MTDARREPDVGVEGGAKPEPTAEPEGRAGPVRLPPGPRSPDHDPIRSVYVHAPFCARRCVYCDFAVHVSRHGDVDGWIDALTGELAAVEADGSFPLADRLDTLYVGGGTPSLLGPEAMARLGGVIGADRLRAPDLEWTAEANPESFTPEVAAGWRRAGVGRISLGVQSFHEPVLRWMGRLHGPEGAERAVGAARSAGLDEISIDLIFGLPKHLDRSWAEDLDRALQLEVPHVSLYGLTVEDGTPLGRAVAEGRERVASEDRYEEEFLEAAERLAGEGYEHYEVSNFARPGHRSRHNRVYWEGSGYLGLGNGAHSYRHPVRRWNLREWDAYSTLARQSLLPEEDREVLDAAACRLERVWLGLRTDRGLALQDLAPPALDRVGRWRAAGLARSEDGAIRLTPRGWLVLDRLAVELDGDLESALPAPTSHTQQYRP